MLYINKFLEIPVTNYFNNIEISSIDLSDIKYSFVYNKNIIINIKEELKRASQLKSNLFFNLDYSDIISTIYLKNKLSLTKTLVLCDRFKKYLPKNVNFHLTIYDNYKNRIVYNPESQHLDTSNYFEKYNFYEGIINFNTKFNILNKLFNIIQEIGFKIIKVDKFYKKLPIYYILGFGKMSTMSYINNKGIYILNYNYNKKYKEYNIDNTNLLELLKFIIPENLIIKYKLNKLNDTK